jgi:hypothetical protein
VRSSSERIGWKTDARSALARERAAQVGGEFGPVDDLRAQDVVEDDHAVAAGFFGRVHRDVGIAQEAVDGFVQRVDGHDADAGREPVFDAFDADRFAERRADRLADVERVGGIGIVVVHEYGELVAADARHQVAERRRATALAAACVDARRFGNPVSASCSA